METVRREGRGQACSRQARYDDIQHTPAHAALEMLPRVRAPPEGGHGDERLSKNRQEPQELQPGPGFFGVQVFFEMLLLRVLRNDNEVLPAQEHD